MRIEYWQHDGEFTADGVSRFVKATIGKPNRNCIKVTFNEDDEIVDVKLVKSDFNSASELLLDESYRNSTI